METPEMVLSDPVPVINQQNSSTRPTQYRSGTIPHVEIYVKDYLNIQPVTPGGILSTKNPLSE